MSSRWVYPDAGIDGLDLESLVMAGHKAAAEEAPEEQIEILSKRLKAAQWRTIGKGDNIIVVGPTPTPEQLEHLKATHRAVTETSEEEEAPKERHFVSRGGETVEVDPAEEEEAPTFWDVGIIVGDTLWPRRIRADYFEIHEGALWLFIGEGKERGTVAVFAPGWVSLKLVEQEA